MPNERGLIYHILVVVTIEVALVINLLEGSGVRC